VPGQNLLVAFSPLFAAIAAFYAARTANCQWLSTSANGLRVTRALGFINPTPKPSVEEEQRHCKEATGSVAATSKDMHQAS